MSLRTENRRQARASEEKACGNNHCRRAEEKYRAVEQSPHIFIVAAPAILSAKYLHAHDYNPNQADNRNNRHEEPNGGLYAAVKENAGDCAVNKRVEKIRELFRYADEQQICKGLLGDSLLSLLRTRFLQLKISVIPHLIE